MTLAVGSVKESVEQQRSLDIEGRLQQFDESISTIREDVAASNQQLRQLPALVDEIRATISATIEKEVRRQVSEHLPQLLKGILGSAVREQIVEAVQPVVQSVLDERANEMSTDEDDASSGTQHHGHHVNDDAAAEPHDDTEMTDQRTPTPSDGVENDGSDRPDEDAASSISRRSQRRSSTLPQPVEPAATMEQSSKVISGISSYVQRAQELVDTQSPNSPGEHRLSAPLAPSSPHRPPSSSPPPVPVTTPPPTTPPPPPPSPPMPAMEVPTTTLSALTPLPSTIASHIGPDLTPAALKEATISTLSVFANAPTSSAPTTQLAQHGFGDSISAMLSHYEDSPAPSQDEQKQ